MTVSRLCLTLFLLLVSWHLGASMQLPLVTWLGMGLTLAAAPGRLRVEHPTLGLIFVLFVTGALAGNQMLESWALEDTWPQENGLGAGIMISLLLYMIWMFAADRENSPVNVVNRSSQSVLVWGLLSLWLLETSESLQLSVELFDYEDQVPVPAVLGMLLATAVLLADRCGPVFYRRLAMLLPVFVVLPLLLSSLYFVQRPMLAALGSVMPRGGEYTPTGFSPYQSLRASVFLRPSNEPVMRIQTDALPSSYLAGNRLVNLNEELVWLPSIRPVRSYGTLDAELLPDNQWRYELDSHHYSGTPIASSMTVYSLGNDDFMFTTPNTTHVTGRFASINRNAADVLTPNYDRGVDSRWVLETGAAAEPDTPDPEKLLLPGFWDEELQAHSEQFAGTTRQATADNIVSYFLARDYTLRTNFDSARPFHDFFLNDKAAYCFWFASASTLALRANGIPSRLVGGYVVHEQLSEDLWLVRERDAHSWVEWQDEEGYWHTIDPTPASINAFFGGYQSSGISQWYHRLAGQWQILFDQLLENENAASLITWGGLAVLVILFAREYRRIRSRQEELDDLGVRWHKLWQRFLRATHLPDRPGWTPGTYAEHLPEIWSADYQGRVREFLALYREARFGETDLNGLKRTEKMLSGLKSARRTVNA